MARLCAAAVAVMAPLVACGGGSTAMDPPNTASQSGGATTSGSGSAVQNHVHGAVLGAAPGEILLGTHYGLKISRDGGTTWQPNASTRNDMVAAIATAGGQYVGAFEAMTQTGQPAAAASVMYSTDGLHWTAATGLASGLISNLVSGGANQAWASITNVGIYRSPDAGRTWQIALPTTKIITAILQVGANLLFATPEGVQLTPSAEPAMPPRPVLAQPVNDLSAWSACTTCLIATLASGDIAVSRDAGASWQIVKTGHAFDSVLSLPGIPATFFGMVSTAPGDQGLWRSGDGGHTWVAVIKQPNVDRLLDLTSAGSALLAFQWGITVWRSGDAGATWSRLSPISGAM